MMTTVDNFNFELKRKIFHFLSIFIVILNYKIDNKYFDICLLIFTILLVFCDFYKIYNLYASRIPLLQKIISIAREDEKTIYTLTGTSYFFLSLSMLTLAFDRKIMTISALIIIIGDPVAALIGKKFGQKNIFKNKTLEGTLAFFVSTFLTILIASKLLHFYLSHFSIFIVSVVATLFELLSNVIKMNDNLSVPIISGFLIFLLKILL